MFILPLSKRRDDLIIGLNQRHRESLNYYSKDLIDNLLIFCLASFFSVLIFWSVSKDTIERLGTNGLPLLLPFILIAIFRYMQFIFVFQKQGSNYKAIKDKQLQIILLLILLIFILIRIYEFDLNTISIF